MVYDLKKTWINLLIAFIICSIISTSGILFFIQELKTSRIIIEAFSCALFLFNFCMYFIIKHSPIHVYNFSGTKIKYRKYVDNFFEQTGRFFFNNEPKIYYNYLKYIFYSFMLCFFIFAGNILFEDDLNLDKIKNNISYFVFLFIVMQVAFMMFTSYFIRPVLTEIIIKFLCYEIKKPIYNNCYFYLNTNNEAFIYKNGMLHCDRLPAYADGFIAFKKNQFGKFLTYDDLKSASDNQLEDIYQSKALRQKRTWYLNGEELTLPNQNYTDKEIRNFIKLKNSATNF